jgi:hypothetical protein
MHHGPDPYTKVLALFDEWQTTHPQPTEQLLEQTTRLHNTITTGNQLADILTDITNAERTRMKGSWQITVSNQLLTQTVFMLDQWRQITETPVQ